MPVVSVSALVQADVSHGPGSNRCVNEANVRVLRLALTGTTLCCDFFGDKNEYLSLLAEAISALSLNHGSQVKTEVIGRGQTPR